MQFSLSKKLLLQALSLSKITTSTLSQHVNSLDHALIRLESDSMRITSTNDSLGSEISLKFLEEAPALIDDAMSFLVRPTKFYDLVAQEPGDVFRFSVDQQKNAIQAVIDSDKLNLAIQNAQDFPDVAARFQGEKSEVSIQTSLLREMLLYTHFFLSGGQDPSRNLVEIRESMGISTDRTKFGFYTSSALAGLEARLPGDQLTPLEQALNHFPETLTVSRSQAYTLFRSSNEALGMTLGISKTAYMLGQGLDGVPAVKEAEVVTVDRKLLAQALVRLSSVGNKIDGRVKFQISGSGSGARISLITTDELGHDSTATVAANRGAGDFSTFVTIILPLVAFQKALKFATSEFVSLTMETRNPKYLKLWEDRGHAVTVSVFQALSQMRA